MAIGHIYNNYYCGNKNNIAMILFYRENKIIVNYNCENGGLRCYEHESNLRPY